MISKKELILAEKEHWSTTVDTVYQWAKVNVPEQTMYNSRMTYWGSALTAGIISRDDYDYARQYYGNLWSYVGD